MMKAGSERCNTAGFEDGGEAMSQECGQPLEVGKDKKNSSLEPPEKNTALLMP